MVKPVYQRKGWRKLGPSIHRSYPQVNQGGTVMHEILARSPLGWTFSLYVSPTKHYVVAGCRIMSIHEYRAHAWTYYSGNVRGDWKDIGRYVATVLILNEFEDRLTAYRKRQKRRRKTPRKGS